VDAHRPTAEPQDLDSTLSYVENRRVTNNYTVSWAGKTYQIPREAVGPGLRSSWIRVEGRLDETIWARVGGQSVRLLRCEPALPELKVKEREEARKDHNRGGKSQWMKNFDLQETPADWVVAKAARRAG